MKKPKPLKLSTLNRIILTTLFSAFIVFCAVIMLISNILLDYSMRNARVMDTEQADQITNSVRNSMYFMTSLLNMTQQSISELDPNSAASEASAVKILKAMLDLTPNVYSAWFIFEKGNYRSDDYYIKEFVKKNGVVIENSSPASKESIEDPGTYLWYSQPLTTGKIYFEDGKFYDYGNKDGVVFTATLSVPIRVKGKIVGVCGIDLTYDDMFESAGDFDREKDKALILLSQDMTILHAYDPSLVSRHLDDFPFEKVEVIRDAITRGVEYTGEIVSPFLHRNAFISLRPIRFNSDAGYPPLYLYISTSIRSLYAEAYHVTFIIIMASIVCMIGIIGIIYLNAHKLFKPITALTVYAQKIAEGDLYAKFSDIDNLLPAAIQEDFLREDSEIATLHRSFIKMVNTLQDTINTVEKRVENRTQDLRKLNSYMLLLMESATDVFMLVDSDMNLIYCSNSVLELLELKSFDDITGKSIDEIGKMVPDREYIERSTRRFLRIMHGEDWIIEDDDINWYRLGRRSYRITYRRVLDDNDKFSGVVLILHDVTDVRMEEAERRLSDILHSTQLPCLVWDEKGDVIAQNEETVRFFGTPGYLSPEDFNSFVLSLLPEYQGDGRKTEDLRQDCIHEALDRGFSKLSIQMRKKDGTPLYLDISVARISWLSKYRMVVYFHDLSEMMKIEAEASEANERIKMMLDSTPLICILRDENGNIIDCNQETLNLFGVSGKQDFISNYGKFFPEFQPDGSRSSEKINRLIRGLSEKGDVAGFEWMYQTADGEQLPAETKLVRIQWKDSHRYLSYSRDLREAKANEKKILESIEQSRSMELQKEAAQAASEAKTQFLANMSHEIRTPMNAVLGMAELLLSETLNQRQERYVRDIKISAMALLEIINDILDVSKIQAGKLHLVPAHYYFKTLVENIGSMVEFLAKNKNIYFKMETHGEIPVCLYGDDVRLRQVLVNVLGNAIKFTSEGGVTFSVAVSDTTVEFSVSDTGIGIPAAAIPTLFEAFEQTDLVKNRDQKGTGLGLSIAWALVGMMDGQITVESEYGRGSVFNIVIPKILGDENLINAAEIEETVLWAPDAKILVVDDNTINLNVICGLLQLWKIAAETATSGQQAIDILRERQFDIVFMDHMMPEMDGMEATRKIRKMGVQTPIIALTAYAVTGAKEMLLASGMNDFLSKPIIKTALSQILKRWIPPEKLIKPLPEAIVLEEGRDDDGGGFWEKIGQLKGLDVQTGLARVSGQKEVYEKSLNLLAKEIDKCDRNLNAFIAAGDMRNFTIEVHSMKGSLANIGAMYLSEKAKELETASDRGNIDFCQANLHPFLNELNSLGNAIKEALSVSRPERGPVEIPPELPGIFNRMMNAFGEMDFLVINDEIENLEAMSLTGQLKDDIEQIKDAVLVMDYDGALTVMKQLLSEA